MGFQPMIRGASGFQPEIPTEPKKPPPTTITAMTLRPLND